MEKRLVNLETFTAKLESYRNSLVEMNQLTEKEVERINSLGKNLGVGNTIERDTAIFIHQQMNTFLDHLREILKEMPNYSISKDVFLCDELEALQKQVLIRLKALTDQQRFG